MKNRLLCNKKKFAYTFIIAFASVLALYVAIKSEPPRNIEEKEVIDIVSFEEERKRIHIVETSSGAKDDNQTFSVYEYDLNGNITETYIYNASGELISYDFKEYDVNGNCIWNESCADILNPSAVSTYQYSYNLSGVLKQKKEYESGTLVSITEYEVLEKSDTVTVVTEFDAHGDIAKQYVYILDREGCEVYYCEYDRKGNRQNETYMKGCS